MMIRVRNQQLNHLMDRYCQHPKHEEYLAAFLRKYPTANKDARFAVNMADPEEWEVSDDPKKNTTSGCNVILLRE